MKISIISDFHLEFCVSTELPGGDLLLAAGDMFSAAPFQPHRQDADARKARKRAEKFCREQLSKYAIVLYVMGNHEHYKFVFDETAPTLRAFLAEHAPNTELFDNEVFTVENLTVLGTTLWARCGIGSPGMMAARIGNSMRDFEWITIERGKRVFQPADANREHQKALAFLEANVPATGTTILLTHHAPSFHSACGHEHGTEYMDDAYCCNLDKFLTDHPNIKLAVHGHTHRSEHYRIGETLVLANPRGYFPHEYQSRHYDPAAADLDAQELIDGSITRSKFV